MPRQGWRCRSGIGIRVGHCPAQSRGKPRRHEASSRKSCGRWGNAIHKGRIIPYGPLKVDTEETSFVLKLSPRHLVIPAKAGTSVVVAPPFYAIRTEVPACAGMMVSCPGPAFAGHPA